LTFSLYATAISHLTSTGLTVTLNNVYYFISPFPRGKVDAPSSLLAGVPTVVGFKPVTVIQEPVAESDIRQLLLNWTVIDDVYQPSFSEAIFVAGPGSKKRGRTTIDTKVDIFPRASSSIVSLKGSKVASGPYFLEVATGSLYPVYRLYEDFAGAFTEPLIPTPDGGFQPLSAKIPGSSTLTVGVPSRLYFTKTAEKPLAGVRLGVKDIFRLAGVRGSNGNRAWYSLYPPSNVTGTAVQRLIDAGAQVIGLQKTSQFANGEFATVEWVDYHAPFNPRGDGYNDASSSSSGAGASVASYEWLDIAVGSDTGGSIRGPAGVQGLFGNRPSHGLVSLDHVMPLSPSLDTPGFVVRDPYLWDAANAALWDKNYTSLANTKPQYPKKIYTLDFPTAPETPAEKLLIDFTNALVEFVAGNVTSLDLEGNWAATKPASAGNATLDQLLNTTYATLISKDQTALVRDPFYRDYAGEYYPSPRQPLNPCSSPKNQPPTKTASPSSTPSPSTAGPTPTPSPPAPSPPPTPPNLSSSPGSPPTSYHHHPPPPDSPLPTTKKNQPNKNAPPRKPSSSTPPPSPRPSRATSTGPARSSPSASAPRGSARWPACRMWWSPSGRWAS
jgi:hypothetical protein